MKRTLLGVLFSCACRLMAEKRGYIQRKGIFPYELWEKLLKTRRKRFEFWRKYCTIDSGLKSA